jgi:mannose-6-phosphate isomerase-like protein (cupin superfamily)
MGNITGKVWGDTSVLIQNSNVELHKINVKAGFRCSEHKHEHKWNGFYVISGTLEIHVRKNDYDLVDVTTLRAGDFTSVRPGEFHWFQCIEDCSALELYYPEALSEDIVRRSVGGKVTVPITVPSRIVVDTDSLLSPTPCVKICQLDELGEKCVGCGRTLAEIADAGRRDIPYEGYDK